MMISHARREQIESWRNTMQHDATVELIDGK